MMKKRLNISQLWNELIAKNIKLSGRQNVSYITHIHTSSKALVPIDYIVFIYTLLTGSLILFFHDRLENVMPHLIFRVGVLGLIIIIKLLYERFPSDIMTFVRYAYPLAIITFFYTETAYYKNLFFPNFDPILVRWEEAIFGFQPSIEFSVWVPFKWFNEIMFMGYFCYYLLTLLLCTAIFIYRREKFQKVSFVIIFSFLIFYLLFISFPAVGPQYYFPYPDNFVPVYGFFGKLERMIQLLAERPTAAFPSAHIGVGIILVYFTLVYLPRLLPAIIIIFIILCFATIYLKAHYLIDVLAGFAIGPIIGFLGSRIYKALTFNTSPPSTKVAKRIMT